jgi:hypothetical protein
VFDDGLTDCALLEYCVTDGSTAMHNRQILYGALIGAIVGQVMSGLLLRWLDSRTVWV